MVEGTEKRAEEGAVRLLAPANVLGGLACTMG